LLAPDTQKRFTEAMVQAFREQWIPVNQNSGYKPWRLLRGRRARTWPSPAGAWWRSGRA